MKRLFDLTVEDLTATPVWRYEGGDGAGAVVAPESRDSLTQADEEIYLACTEFQLADSSRYLGLCFPVDDASLEYLQPVIVTPAGHVRFWFEGAVAPEILANQWRALGKREDEIFPVSFRCLIPVDGRTVSGVIPRVEISTSVAPAGPAEPAGKDPGTSDHSFLPTRPDRVRRLFSVEAGIPERRSPRRRAEMLVEFDAGDASSSGVTLDISRGGMFIRSAELPRLGPSLSLTMRLPGGRTVFLKGRVVRRAPEPEPSRSPGFALELTEKTEEYDAFLDRLHDPSR